MARRGSWYETACAAILVMLEKMRGSSWIAADETIDADAPDSSRTAYWTFEEAWRRL